MSQSATNSQGVADAGRLRQTARYHPLLVVLIAACGGIVADRAFCLPLSAALLAAFLAWGGCTAADRNDCAIASGLLALALAGLAAAWHHMSWYSFAVDDLGAFAAEEWRPVAVEARLVMSPRVTMPSGELKGRGLTEAQSRVLVEAVALRDRQTWVPASGRATLWVEGQLVGLHAGDRVRVFGRIARPPPTLNPGGFSLAEHLQAIRQLATLRAASPEAVQLVRRGSRWLPRRLLDDLRAAGMRQLARYGSPREVNLSSALLLGAREQVDPEQTQEFLVTGTIHLLSISGLHVGILAALVLALERLGLIGLRAALLLAIAVTVVYAALADAEAPVVRATTLVVILCATRLLGREALSPNSLALCALVVLAAAPADLFRVGPQLSFLATLALGWAAAVLYAPREVDPLNRLLAQSRPAPIRAAARFGRFLAAAIWMSLVVWALTLPLVWARFHVVSPIAVALGAVLWLPVTVAMWAGFGLLTTGWIAAEWARALSWLCDAGLSSLNTVIEAAARAPGAYFWAPGPPEWWLWGFYGAVVLWGLKPAIRTWRRTWLALAAAWIAIGLAAALVPRGDGALSVEVLAVGHGSAATVEWPDGAVWVCDAGSQAAPRRAAEAVAGALWRRHRRRIDTLVISHADADHFNGVPALVERFAVGRIVVPPGFADSKQPAVVELLRLVAGRGIPLEAASAGARLRELPDGEARVLHPPLGFEASDNARSLVLSIDWRGQRAILPGDLEPPGIEAVLAEAPRDAALLVAPHHGSARSDVPGMSAWCRPEVVVISGGFHADVPRVAQAYRSGGAAVFHTPRSGAVTWRVAPDGEASVACYRRPER